MDFFELIIEGIMDLFTTKNQGASTLKKFKEYQNNFNPTNTFGNNNYVKPLPIVNNGLNTTTYTEDSLNESKNYTESSNENGVKPNTTRQLNKTLLNLNFTNKNLGEGLIYSEILGKPLSKRKHRRERNLGNKRFNR